MNNVNNLKLRSIAIDALQDQAGVRTNSSSSGSGFDPTGSNWLPAVEVVGSGKPKGSGSGSGKETDPSLPNDPGPGGPSPSNPGGTGGWPPPFPGGNGEDTNPGEGNTGGNGNGNIPTNPIPPKVDPEKLVKDLVEANNLKDANSALIKAVENMVAQYIYKILLEEAKKRGLRMRVISIIKGLSAVAVYDVATNSMFFQSEEAISVAFAEEFLHFLQNKIYKNGIGQYADTAKSNIEFEAKLIQDICEWLNGNRTAKNFKVELSTDIQKEYILYLESVVQGGTFPTLDSLKKGAKNYDYFQRKFHEGLYFNSGNPKPQLKEGMIPELINEMPNMLR